MRTHRMSWLVVASLVMGLASISIAQETASPTAAPSSTANPREGRLEAALQKLNLDEQQKAKIQQILADQSLQGRARFQAIQAVLTPEQRQQLQQLMPHRGRHQGGEATPPANTP